MQTPSKLPFFTLLLLISFASVNAVLFTPALPDIAIYFHVSNQQAQLTIAWFLVGYALGQLLYGPLANRFGRKPALYMGIALQIVSSLLCVVSGFIHEFNVLIIGRILLALGSGVGLKMTFTLVSETYEPKMASQKISYLILAFAITPAMGVALGGILSHYFSWVSCFYACALYGVVLLLLVTQLPETKFALDYDALKIQHLFDGYISQFKNLQLVTSGLLMGGSTAFVYVFAALAPFIAINLLGMNSAEYGGANLLPAMGLIFGSILSAQLVKKFAMQKIILNGILIAGCGILLMIIAVLCKWSALTSLFVPMTLIYFGLALVMGNASTLALSHAADKANGAAVMSFVNMGSATLVVLSLSLFHVTTLLLPLIFVGLFVGMMGVCKYNFRQKVSVST